MKLSGQVYTKSNKLFSVKRIAKVYTKSNKLLLILRVPGECAEIDRFLFSIVSPKGDTLSNQNLKKKRKIKKKEKSFCILRKMRKIKNKKKSLHSRKNLVEFLVSIMRENSIMLFHPYRFYRSRAKQNG